MSILNTIEINPYIFISEKNVSLYGNLVELNFFESENGIFFKKKSFKKKIQNIFYYKYNI